MIVGSRVSTIGSGVEPDVFSSNVSILLHADGVTGSTTILDSSDYENTLTLSGNVQLSDVQKKFGDTSIFFDGTGDFIDITGDSDIINFLSANCRATVEFWIYPTTLAGTSKALLSRWLSNDGWEIYVTTTGALGLIRDNSGTGVAPNGSIVANQWTHIAMVVHGLNAGGVGNTVYFFVNGVFTGNAAMVTSSNNNSLRIGARSGGTLPFTGYIDEFRITLGEERYTTSGFIVQDEPFIDPDVTASRTKLLLHANGINGATSMSDSSEYSNTFVFNGNAQLSTVHKKFDTASMYFDGSGDSITVNGDVNTGLSAIAGIGKRATVDFWVRPLSTGTSRNLLSKWNSNDGWFVSISATNALTISINNVTYTLSSANTIPVDTWTHVAIVNRGKGFIAFINGVYTNFQCPFALGSTTTPLIIGSSAFNGYIDELRIIDNYPMYSISGFSTPTTEY